MVSGVESAAWPIGVILAEACIRNLASGPETVTRSSHAPTQCTRWSCPSSRFSTNCYLGDDGGDWWRAMLVFGASGCACPGRSHSMDASQKLSHRYALLNAISHAPEVSN